MSAAMLLGKRIVVTGASRGLGRAISVELARQGAEILMTGRDEAALSESMAEVVSVGGRAQAFSLDVTDSDAIERFAELVWTNDPVDAVFANAGISLVKPADQTSDAEFMRVLDTNVRGTFATFRAFGPRMLARGHGKLIATSSDIGIRGSAGWIAYAASKGAVNAMVRTLAWEWAPKVTVNAIAPGAFATDINSHLLSDPQIMQAITSQTPLARVGRPEEIGPLAALLAGPGSDFITGQILSIDGGIQKS